MVFLAPAYARGTGLAWEARQIEATAGTGRTRMDFDFRFHNSSLTPVRVLHVGTDCDCTTATASKAVFAAGESGAIHVTVTTEGWWGDQRRTVLITTSAEPEHPVSLTLTIKASVLAVIEPRVVLLDRSNGSAPQYFTVRIREGLVGKIQSVKFDAAGLTASIEPVAAGRVYRVGVTSAREDRPRSVNVEILVEVNGRAVPYPATVIFRPSG